MIEIDDKIVSLDLLRERFCCDLSKCKGICCVEGDSGAPLDIEEVDILEEEWDNYSPYMTDEGRKATWIIQVKTTKKPEAQLLGSAIGMKVMEDVPYVYGLDQWLGEELDDAACAYLKDFGAATASNGAVGLYHIHNLTPEAKELGESLKNNGLVQPPTVRKNKYTAVSMICLIVFNLAMGIFSQPILSALAGSVKEASGLVSPLMLVVTVVGQVMKAAVELREENDLTI